MYPHLTGIIGLIYCYHLVYASTTLIQQSAETQSLPIQIPLIHDGIDLSFSIIALQTVLNITPTNSFFIFDGSLSTALNEECDCTSAASPGSVCVQANCTSYMQDVCVPSDPQIVNSANGDYPIQVGLQFTSSVCIYRASAPLTDTSLTLNADPSGMHLVQVQTNFEQVNLQTRLVVQHSDGTLEYSTVVPSDLNQTQFSITLDSGVSIQMSNLEFPAWDLSNISVTMDLNTTLFRTVVSTNINNPVLDEVPDPSRAGLYSLDSSILENWLNSVVMDSSDEDWYSNFWAAGLQLEFGLTSFVDALVNPVPLSQFQNNLLTVFPVYTLTENPIRPLVAVVGQSQSQPQQQQSFLIATLSTTGILLPNLTQYLTYPSSTFQMGYIPVAGVPVLVGVNGTQICLLKNSAAMLCESNLTTRQQLSGLTYVLNPLSTDSPNAYNSSLQFVVFDAVGQTLNQIPTMPSTSLFTVAFPIIGDGFTLVASVEIPDAEIPWYYIILITWVVLFMINVCMYCTHHYTHHRRWVWVGFVISGYLYLPAFLIVEYISFRRGHHDLGAYRKAAHSM